MKKYILIALPLLTLNALAFDTTCPTCPKTYTKSKMEELLKNKNQNLTKQFKTNNSLHKNEMTKIGKKTPIQIVASRTEQLKKVTDRRVNNVTWDTIDSAANQARQKTRSQEEYERLKKLTRHKAK